MDNPPHDFSSEILHDVIIEAPTKRFDGSQAPTCDTQIDWSSSTWDGSDILVPLVQVHFETFLQQNHCTQWSNKTRSQNDDVALVTNSNLLTGKSLETMPFLFATKTGYLIYIL